MQHWDKSKDEKRDAITRQTNKRKSTAKWCKGKVGVEHQPELVINHNMTHLKPCSWRVLYRFRGGEREVWRWLYYCKHSYKCTNCGKYTEVWLKNKEECPDFTPREE